jgi:hypothetical protein
LFVTNAGEFAESKSDTKQPENKLPEIMDFRYDKIGVGQRLKIRTEVIEEEGDLVRTELVEKPKRRFLIKTR